MILTSILVSYKNRGLGFHSRNAKGIRLLDTFCICLPYYRYTEHLPYPWTPQQLCSTSGTPPSIQYQTFPAEIFDEASVSMVTLTTVCPNLLFTSGNYENRSKLPQKRVMAKVLQKRITRQISSCAPVRIPNIITVNRLTSESLLLLTFW